MMRGARTAGFLALALLGCTSEPSGPGRRPPADTLLSGAAPAAPDWALGQQIAVDVCGRCHALEGEGPSPHRAAPPFPVLARRLSADALLPLLEEGIRAVHPDMPEIRLAPAEIDSFLAFWSQL
jgi:cytochrome c